MAGNFDKLSDLTMLDIFNRLSVSELMVAGHVCARFMLFRGYSANSRTALALLVCPKYCVPAYVPPFIKNTEIAHSDLLPKDGGSRIFYEQKTQQELFRVNCIISAEFAEFLAELFPKILNLDINVKDISIKNLDGLVEMLKKFGNLLEVTRLRINLKCGDNLVCKTRPHIRLLSAINSMTTLKCLEFHYTRTKNLNARIHLPLLARFEEFTLTGFDDFFGELSDSITSFAVRNLKLTKIALNFVKLSPNIWTEFLKAKPKFGACFSNISLVISDGNLLDPLFKMFHNLTSITILFKTPMMDIFELYRSLSALHQLVHIKFVFNGNDLNNLRSGFLNINRNEYPRLTSVKVITYQISHSAAIISHSLFVFFGLGHFFPLVEIVKFTHEPALCRECHNEANATQFRFYISCFRYVILILQVAFPHLKSVLVDDVVFSSSQIKAIIATIRRNEEDKKEDVEEVEGETSDNELFNEDDDEENDQNKDANA